MQEQQQESTPSAPVGEVMAVQFAGKGGGLLWEGIKCYFLILVTAGIYTFWANVRLRKFLWSHTSFLGQAFSYHGTGKELFIGYLKVVGIFVALGALLAGAVSVAPESAMVLSPVIALTMAVLTPWARFNSRRYRVSRTAWKGVRFGMNPVAADYAKLYLIESILVGLTFGLRYPYMANRLYAFKTNNTYYGNMKFRYTGNDKEMFWMFLKSIPLFVLTLGIYFLWYQAKVFRYRAEHTWFGTAELGAAKAHLTMTGGGILWQLIKAELFIMVTLGIGTPWAICGLFRWAAESLTFHGKVNLDQVEASESQGDAVGEGLAAALG